MKIITKLIQAVSFFRESNRMQTINNDSQTHSISYFECLILSLECRLSNGIPVVSRSVDQEINDVIDSIFKYYIGSWMERLLYDKEEVIFITY